MLSSFAHLSGHQSFKVSEAETLRLSISNDNNHIDQIEDP